MKGSREATEVLEPPELPGSWDVHDDSGARRLPGPDPDAQVSREGALRIYAALCAVAHVDGQPTRAQRRELDDYQEYLGLTPWVAQVIETQALGERALRMGRRPAELELLMGAMIDLAAADGRISRREGRLLARVNEHAGWSRARIARAFDVALERAAAEDPDDATDTCDVIMPESVQAALRASWLEDSGEGELALGA